MNKRGVSVTLSIWIAITLVLVVMVAFGFFNGGITGDAVNLGGSLGCVINNQQVVKPLSGESAYLDVSFNITGDDVQNYTVVLGYYDGTVPAENGEHELCRVGGGAIKNGTLLPAGRVTATPQIYRCNWTDGKNEWDNANPLDAAMYNAFVFVKKSDGTEVACSNSNIPLVNLTTASSGLSCSISNTKEFVKLNADSFDVDFTYSGDAERYRLVVGNYNASRVPDEVELCRVGPFNNGTVTDEEIDSGSNAQSYECSWSNGKSALNVSHSLVAGDYGILVLVSPSEVGSTNSDFVSCEKPDSVHVLASCLECNNYDDCLRSECNALSGCSWDLVQEVCKDAQIIADCVPNWAYSNWTTCINGQQTRQAVDNNNCGSSEGRGNLTQTCSGGIDTSGTGSEANNQPTTTGGTKTNTKIIFYGLIIAFVIFILLIGVVIAIIFIRRKKKKVMSFQSNGNEMLKSKSSGIFIPQQKMNDVQNSPADYRFKEANEEVKPIVKPEMQVEIKSKEEIRMNEKLNQAKILVKNARMKGFSDMQIRDMFVKKGWTPDQLRTIGL